MKIRPLAISDLAMLGPHHLRHSMEKGRDGDVVFAPHEEHYPASEADLKRAAESLAKAPTEIGWMRQWIVTDEKEIYGMLTLVHRPPMKATLHRCLLMMGLERSIRRQGFGAALIKEAIAWAKAQPSLDWMSLNVFENNPGAKALYTKLGFKEVGTSRDLFRFLVNRSTTPKW